MRIVAKLPEGVFADESIQFFAVHLRDVVKGGAAETVSPLARSGIQVRAAVAHHVEAVQKELEAQDVVVPVPAAAAHPDLAAIDDNVRRRAAKHIETPGWKRDRPERRGIALQPVERGGVVRSQQPERFVPEMVCGRLQVAARESNGAGREQVAVIVDRLRPELLHAPIVRVSDERRQAARLGVRRHEVEHPPQPRPLALRHRLAVLLEQQIRREEQLQHEPVVGRRLLEIDAIFRDLLEHLVAHNAPASGQPVASSGGVLEEQPEEHETGAVARVVVSVHIGRFGVREHELAVHEQAAQEGAPEPRVRAGLRACHEVETPDPADGAQRHVHRAGPVHAVGKRIDGDPILDLCPVLARVSVVAGQPVRLPKGREVLTAAQFPRHFHVGCLIELHVRDVAAVLERIVTARLEIVEPRKPGAEGFGARAEQVELVATASAS